MKNEAIRCDVTNCRHNAQTEKYCTLSSISVGTHEPNPTMCECTDCRSFDLKSECTGGGCR